MSSKMKRSFQFVTHRAIAEKGSQYKSPFRPGGIFSTSKSQISGGVKMECGVSAGSYTNGTPAGILSHDVRSERSPAKAGLHVNFSDKSEVKERREKFLTAKYGNHQMSLIRKRLAVEMWLYEELKKLYTTKQSVDDVNGEEVEIDIDELLDMDSDEERRKHLQKLLIGAKQSQCDVKKFINDLLDKAKTL